MLYEILFVKFKRGINYENIKFIIIEIIKKREMFLNNYRKRKI